jgi:hypothetical protein
MGIIINLCGDFYPLWRNSGLRSGLTGHFFRQTRRAKDNWLYKVPIVSYCRQGGGCAGEQFQEASPSLGASSDVGGGALELGAVPVTSSL